MRQQKQPAPALAFNRQHKAGTAPTHLQPADLAPRQQAAASWQTVLSRAIPTDAARADALKVLESLTALIQQGRWYDLAIVAIAAEDILQDSPESRRT